MKEIPISFTQEIIHLDEQKDNNFVYPDKVVKLTDIQKTLKSNRIKRTSTTLIRNKDPQTSIDPLQIIDPVIQPEYGMLFEHQGYLMLGLQILYLFIAIKLPRVTDLLHDHPLMPHCN